MRRLDPPRFPKYEDKKVVDGALDRLDTRGVSRRDLLKLASASAVLAAGSPLLGVEGAAAVVVVVDKGGKMAHLMMTLKLEYVANADAGAKQAAEALGMSITSVDGDLDAQKQLNQFEQQITAGVKGVLIHSPDGSNIRRSAMLGNQHKVWMTNTWGTLPWFTPFDAGDYYTLYAVPEEFSAHRGVTEALCKALQPKGGNIVRVQGVPGNTTDLIRTRGANDALKAYRNVKLAGELPGNWNREASQKAMEDLLSRHPDMVGVIGQNDDVADGCIAALRARGKVPGKDVLVTGADGTSGGAAGIKKGELLATSANVPAYMGAFLTIRLYDVMHGWKPRASERLMNWRSVTMTKANVDAYLNRYVNNGNKPPFDYKRMSHVIRANDWDPQAEVLPMDIELEWGGITKPSGFKLPAAYAKAKESGEMERTAKEYAEHYKIKFFGPAPA